MKIIFIIILVIIIILLIPGYTPSIKTNNNNGENLSIASLLKVKIGNTEQWVLIRSENINNPILLFVHGGPGTSELTLNRKNTQQLEKYFTVVNWDQRGAGKSYSAGGNKQEMNIDQFVSDISDLSKYLEKRFNKNKITLVGHSWGSAIGMLAIKKDPGLFNAYIGIGQVSNLIQGDIISYEFTLEEARKASDTKSINKLVEIGKPPYTGDGWKSKLIAQRKILGQYGGEYYSSKNGAMGAVLMSVIFSTEYTVIDKINYFRAIFNSIDLLWPDLSKVDLFEQMPKVDVPVYFMLGRHDYEVPSVLSEKYFNELEAPYKKLVWFENSAHLPNTEEKDAFNNVLITQVLPVVLKNQ